MSSGDRGGQRHHGSQNQADPTRPAERPAFPRRGVAGFPFLAGAEAEPGGILERTAMNVLKVLEPLQHQTGDGGQPQAERPHGLRQQRNRAEGGGRVDHPPRIPLETAQGEPSRPEQHRRNEFPAIADAVGEQPEKEQQSSGDEETGVGLSRCAEHVHQGEPEHRPGEEYEQPREPQGPQQRDVPKR